MQIRVLYNKSCNICRKEIDHYKKYSDKKISWIDILNDKNAKMLTSKTKIELIRRMHVIKDGEIVEGAKAFLEIWKRIPRYRFLYYIFKIKFFIFFISFFMKLLQFFFL